MLLLRILPLASILIVARVWHSACAGKSVAWRPSPGDKIPYAFEIETLHGNYSLDPENGVGVPLIFHAYLPEDASLRYMWSPDNADAIAAFLEDLPADTHVLFCTYSNDSARDMAKMYHSLLRTLERAGLDAATAHARLSNIHFAQAPMSGVSDKGANFLPNLLGHWTSARAVVQTSDLGKGEQLIGRLDVAYEWLPWPAPGGKHEVVDFGDGCGDEAPLEASGRVALIVRGAKTGCSFAEMISRAQAAKASAVLVSALPDEDVTLMRCQGRECEIPLQTFATMVPYEFARELQIATRERGTDEAAVRVSFGQDSGPGYYAAVDDLGRLQEVGWVKFPTLQHLSWAAQWLEYARRLRTALEAPALVVPVYEEEVMKGEHGIVKEISLPSASELDQYARLELDFQLSCPGTLDADCPIWDHVIQLFVCCDEASECPKCDATPWLMTQHHPEDGSETAWKATMASGNVSVPERECGQELGRWVTPFRRRIGRWLTDVTHLRGLLHGEKCRFTTQTAPWALPWKPSLRLRFKEKRNSGSETLRIHRLFAGGTFDAAYNRVREPARPVTPKGTTKALLHVVVTGHGYDDNSCAEFCITSHHFTVNGHEFLVNFTEAGTPWGCTKHVLEGVEPNEHGTWQYGRGGWCDGVNVEPRTFDVTDLISQAGTASTISYQGLYRGRDPEPLHTPGYIMLESSIVYLATPTTSGSGVSIS